MKLPQQLFDDIDHMMIEYRSEKWNPTLFKRRQEIEIGKLNSYDDKKLVNIAIHCIQEWSYAFLKEVDGGRNYIPMLQKDLKLLSRQELIDWIELYYYDELDYSDPDYIQWLVEVYMRD